MTPRERDKALLVEWLIRFGTDWVNVLQRRESGLQMEIGRLERMHYLEYKWFDHERGFSEGAVRYRITDKGLALLKEDDRE
jgi:hypothetical protein